MASPRRLGKLLKLGLVESWANLERLVEEGLPVAAVGEMVTYLAPKNDPGAAKMVREVMVHPSMLKRKLKVLPPAAGERVGRVARITALAEEVWGNRESARRFLFRPHPLLGGRTPLQASRTDLGGRQVEELLLSAAHGLPL